MGEKRPSDSACPAEFQVLETSWCGGRYVDRWRRNLGARSVLSTVRRKNSARTFGSCQAFRKVFFCCPAAEDSPAITRQERGGALAP